MLRSLQNVGLRRVGLAARVWGQGRSGAPRPTLHQTPPTSSSPRPTLFSASPCAVTKRPFHTTQARSSTRAAPTPSSPASLPDHADIVIGGGGVIGLSLAYHLAAQSANVLLLEQGALSGGTSWHAAGLVGKLRATPTEIALSNYASGLYSRLEAETGMATGWTECGSITVARCSERFTVLQRNLARAHALGIEARLIDRDEIAERHPLVRTDDLVGALWLPGDGTITSTDLCMALAKGARMNGAQLVERAEVERVETTSDGAVAGVCTADGQRVACRVFVNCGGLWARQLGQRSTPPVHVPLHAAEHFYIVSRPIDGMHPQRPVVRDPDGYIYMREWSGGVLAGGFEPLGLVKPCFHESIPHPFEFALLQEDWEHVEWAVEEFVRRMPVLATTEIRQLLNGPESFTADNQYILGPAPEIRGYFVAAGMNSSGIASAAGAGAALSHWILHGSAARDMSPVDIRRLPSFANNKRFLRDRCAETLGMHYALPWPRYEMVSARNIRVSPLHEHLKRAGGVFGTKMGWERVNWFVTPSASDGNDRTSAPTSEQTRRTYTFGCDGEQPEWLPSVTAEVRACRTSAALFDMTSFSKLAVQGRDALTVLQRLCCNNVDVAPGGVVYTGMLNDRGGYESDCTVIRKSVNHFLVISGSAQTTRDLSWMERSIGADEFAVCTDVTSASAVLALMGPRARDILQRISSADLSDEVFPFGSAQTIELANTIGLAVRMSYVGELGWELHVPTEMAVHVFEALMDPADADARSAPPTLAGYYAIEALRLEKGFRAFGHELSGDDTPLDAGLGFTLAMDKTPAFRGRAALEQQKRSNKTRRHLLSFVVDDPQANLPWGGELILHNGQPAGFLTSATFSPTLGRAIGMGYVSDSRPLREVLNDQFEVQISGRRYAAKACRSAIPRDSSV